MTSDTIRRETSWPRAASWFQMVSRVWKPDETLALAF